MRVLYLAVSPDGQTIVTGAGDETLRFWNVFPDAKCTPLPPSLSLSPSSFSSLSFPPLLLLLFFLVLLLISLQLNLLQRQVPPKACSTRTQTSDSGRRAEEKKRGYISILTHPPCTTRDAAFGGEAKRSTMEMEREAKRVMAIGELIK